MAYDQQNLKARQFTIDRRTEILASIAEDVTNNNKDRISALVALCRMEGIIKPEGEQMNVIVSLMDKAGYDVNAIPKDSVVNGK